MFLLFSLGFFLKDFFESLNTILFFASSKEKSGIYTSLYSYTLLLRIHNERGVENVLRPSNALGGDERQPGPDGRHERAAGAVGRRRGLRGVLDDRYESFCDDDDVRDLRVVFCVSRVISSSFSSSNSSLSNDGCVCDANSYCFFLLTMCALVVAPLSSCASSSRCATTHRG